MANYGVTDGSNKHVNNVGFSPRAVAIVVTEQYVGALLSANKHNYTLTTLQYQVKRCRARIELIDSCPKVVQLLKSVQGVERRIEERLSEAKINSQRDLRAKGLL